MQPSAKYDVDYTDGYGFKWTKPISTIYPNVGSIDESIGLNRYDNDIVKKIYRKPTDYNALYYNSNVISGAPGYPASSIKYLSANYPASTINTNTVIITELRDGDAYSIGVNEDATTPINRGYMSSQRLLRDGEYNKMLFRVNVREMSFVTHNNVIQKDNYEDPTYIDVAVGDIDDNKYYAIFYHSSAKVWNGSGWDDYNIEPALLIKGEINETFQGAGSAFNNLFNNYPMHLGTSENIWFTNASSNYYWTAQNCQGKMYNDRYALAWSDEYNYRPVWADDYDSAYNAVRQWLVDNSIPAWNDKNFELSREIKEVGNDCVVLMTIICTAGLDNNNNLYIRYCNTITFPMLKGSSMSKFIAGFGVYYLADNNADLTGITPNNLGDSNDVWLGEMSSDGTTTGKWIKGSELNTYTGYNKTGNIINPDYDPTGGGGGEESFDSDPSAYNDAYTTGVPSSQLYAMTLAQVNDMFSKLTNGGIIPANFEPGNAVISIQRYPFSLSSFASAVESNITWTARPDVIGPETPTRIMFPPTGQEIKGYPIYNPVKKVSLGSFKLSEFWNNYIAFLNREISASLYIPFCGIIEIDINAILNKTITVYLTIDVISGGCTAAIDINGCMYTTVSGSCSADMYFSTSNYGTIRAALRSNTAEQVYNVAQLAAGAIGAAATGGLTAGWATQAATGAGFNILGKAIKRTMMRNGVTPSVHGSAGDMSGWKLPMHCQLILSLPRPNHSSDSIYGHSHGYLTVSEKTVGSCSGLAVCDNPDVSNIGTATDNEKEMIYNMLQNGVYV